jgi:CRP-like cAMP-binding protein
MKAEELVRDCPLFYHIKAEDLPALLECLRARELCPEKGEFILTSHQEEPLIGVVLAGSVQMISEDYFGKKSILSILPVGSVFGESYSCVKARNRSIAYQANERSQVLLLDYAHIFHDCNLVCRFHHRMIENMVQVIAEKNLELIEKLEVASQGSIREKLLTYLTRQAEREGSLSFTVPMGRTALAEYLCVDRSAMTRELAKMRDEGILSYEKRSFRLYKGLT